METADAFLYAHNYQRLNVVNPGKFEDCMEGTIRLLTAITPSYLHAYQALCLTRCPSDILRRRFRLPVAKAKYSNLPNNRTSTRNKGDFFKAWAIFTDGGTVPRTVKPQLGCRRPFT